MGVILAQRKSGNMLAKQKTKFTLLVLGIVVVLFYFVAALALLVSEIVNYSSTWNNEFYIGVSIIWGIAHLFGCLFQASTVFLTFRNMPNNTHGFTISNIISYMVSVFLFLLQCWLVKGLINRFSMYYNDCTNVKMVESLIAINSFEIGGQIAISICIFIAFNVNYQQLLLGLNNTNDINNNKWAVPTKAKMNSLCFNLLNGTSFVVSMAFVIGSRLMMLDWQNLPHLSEYSQHRKITHSYCAVGLAIACLINSMTVIFGLKLSNKFKNLVENAYKCQNKCKNSCHYYFPTSINCNNLSYHNHKRLKTICWNSHHNENCNLEPSAKCGCNKQTESNNMSKDMETHSGDFAKKQIEKRQAILRNENNALIIHNDNRLNHCSVSTIYSSSNKTDKMPRLYEIVTSTLKTNDLILVASGNCNKIIT